MGGVDSLQFSQKPGSRYYTHRLSLKSRLLHIILPSTPRSWKWSLSKFSDQFLEFISHVSYAPSSTQRSLPVSTFSKLVYEDAATKLHAF
jgi:hypothetical protein